MKIEQSLRSTVDNCQPTELAAAGSGPCQLEVGGFIPDPQ